MIGIQIDWLIERERETERKGGMEGESSEGVSEREGEGKKGGY